MNKFEQWFYDNELAVYFGRGKCGFNSNFLSSIFRNMPMEWWVGRSVGRCVFRCRRSFR